MEIVIPLWFYILMCYCTTFFFGRSVYNHVVEGQYGFMNIVDTGISGVASVMILYSLFFGNL